jgi:hypothetical protein
LPRFALNVSQDDNTVVKTLHLLLDIDVVCDVEDRRCSLSMPSTVLLIGIVKALYSVGYISARIRSTVGGSVRRRRCRPGGSRIGARRIYHVATGEGRGEASGALVGSSLLSSAWVRPRVRRPSAQCREAGYGRAGLGGLASRVLKVGRSAVRLSPVDTLTSVTAVVPSLTHGLSPLA